jgi:hypothetical protein
MSEFKSPQLFPKNQSEGKIILGNFCLWLAWTAGVTIAGWLGLYLAGHLVLLLTRGK